VIASLDPTLAALATPTATEPKTADAAREFEAYMVSFLAQQMRASLPKSSFGGQGMEMFAGLFDQEVGRRASEGPGLGLRRQLDRLLGNSVPATGEIRSLGASRQATPSALAAAVRSLAGAAARITSHFGDREDPVAGGRRGHHGIDIAAPQGSPVRSIAAGTVSFAGAMGDYGNCVVIDHGDGTQSRYAHCADLRVATGQTIEAGHEVGTVGATGRATGPHLHFEVRRDGLARDPIEFLRGRS
jgi:murein DD-endopeptidase MepM/ murein hydrolase activator NlpD